MIQTREISSLKSTIIMFGKIAGGTKSNIIPEKVDLEGSIRFLYKAGPDSEEQPTERFKRVAEQVCRTYGCSCQIEIIHENIPLINHSEMAALARQVALETFREQGAIIDNISMASEDFSEFSERVPGVFIFLGVGNPAKETTISHHNPRFNIDEAMLSSGVEFLVRGVLRFFEPASRLRFLKKEVA